MTTETSTGDNGIRNNWMTDTLAKFVPQLKESGKYDGFVELCKETLKDDKLGRIKAVLSKYVTLDDGELYLVVGEICKQSASGMNISKQTLKRKKRKKILE